MVRILLNVCRLSIGFVFIDRQNSCIILIKAFRKLRVCFNKFFKFIR